MALWCAIGDVLRLVLTHGVRLTIIGVAIGLVGAYLVTRAITSVLYGVSATDPLTFVFISLFVSCSGVARLLCPARRRRKSIRW
jgi:hypothetical protein